LIKTFSSNRDMYFLTHQVMTIRTWMWCLK